MTNKTHPLEPVKTEDFVNPPPPHHTASLKRPSTHPAPRAGTPLSQHGSLLQSHSWGPTNPRNNEHHRQPSPGPQFYPYINKTSLPNTTIQTITNSHEPTHASNRHNHKAPNESPNPHTQIKNTTTPTPHKSQHHPLITVNIVTNTSNPTSKIITRI